MQNMQTARRKNMMCIHVMTSPPKAVKEAKCGQFGGQLVTQSV